MGLHKQMARFIIREGKYAPIRGSVLLIGRQTVHLTLEGFFELMREEGVSVDPSIPVELDSTTLSGKEKSFISDRYFFKTLGAAVVTAIDVSDYEGAEIVHNLDTPIPAHLEAKFDFICNGSVLDNMFNPVMGLSNISRMLAPGGRVVHFEHASNAVNMAYLQFSPNWFFDYYVVNGYADCKTYVALFRDLDGPWDFYACLYHDKHEPQLFSSSHYAMTAVIAESAAGSTWDRYPIQAQYRGPEEGPRYLNGQQRIDAAARPFMAPSGYGLSGPKVWARQYFHRLKATVNLIRQAGLRPKRLARTLLLPRLPIRFVARWRGYLRLGKYY
jgi:SAM-dependent methyltransferase